jgi:hypothetical protein
MQGASVVNGSAFGLLARLTQQQMGKVHDSVNLMPDWRSDRKYNRKPVLAPAGSGTKR